MAPRYLIDGYNLIHAIGLLSGRVSHARTLQTAREKLIDFLHAAFDRDCSRIEVVFDAHTSLKKAAPFRSPLGVSVCFAKVADDLIREVIRADSHPTSLHVVSNDHAIQVAAKHRGAVILNCDAFLDAAERHKKTGPDAPRVSDAKPEPADDEVDYWLRKFADLE